MEVSVGMLAKILETHDPSVHGNLSRMNACLCSRVGSLGSLGPAKVYQLFEVSCTRGTDN